MTGSSEGALPDRALADEIECTAFDTTASNERNALFTPPCLCPRCRPSDRGENDPDGPKTIWLRPEGGRPVRHEVVDMELGDGASRHL